MPLNESEKRQLRDLLFGNNAPDKKISGDYFKENRDWIPVNSRLEQALLREIDGARMEAAKKYMENQERQKKSREEKLGKYSMTTPLPSTTLQEYLSKHMSLDTWCYVQYGALFRVDEKDRLKISEDARAYLVDLLAKKESDEQTVETADMVKKEGSKEKFEYDANGVLKDALYEQRLKQRRMAAAKKKRIERELRNKKYALIGGLCIACLFAASIALFLIRR